MKILFDTNAWLWLHDEPARLSPAARNAIQARENELFLSTVVPWEMAIKAGRARFRPVRPLDDLIGDMTRSVPATLLPITQSHALRVATLPIHHRDPFDRILIAQAQVEGLTILTADRRFSDYEVELIAA